MCSLAPPPATRRSADSPGGGIAFPPGWPRKSGAKRSLCASHGAAPAARDRTRYPDRITMLPLPVDECQLLQGRWFMIG
jgi:hypothetical protein